MTSLLRKALAFIRRDFQIESSYKMSFVMNIVDSMMVLIFFYFLDQLVSRGESRFLARYGGNFLAFAVVGLAFARYFQLTLRMFSESIRTAQLSGCLEAMLSSQTDALTIVLMSSLYGLLSGAVQPLLILIAGGLIMGVDLSHMNVLATILVFAGAQETVFKGVLLLAIYSLGLAVPFLLTSLGVDRFLVFYGRFRRHLHTVEVISGVLLIAVGVLIFMNNLKFLSGYLSFLNRFAL